MNKVYINIHPNHGYSTVILSSYLNIKDYIREVSWTSWNIGQKRSFIVTGYDKNKPQEHLRRVEVVAQRLLNAGMEVLARNERGEDWGNFEDKGFSEDYMLSFECETDDADEILETIRVYEDFLKENADLDDTERKSILKDIAIEKGNMEALKAQNYLRKKVIKDLWIK